MFLVCALLLASAVLGAGECVFGTRFPLLSDWARSVLDRATNARRNWEHETLRSFVETSSWIWISMQLHLHYGDARVSAPLGALCGFGVVALGDSSRCCSGRLPPPCSTTRIATFLRLATCTRPSSRSSRLPS